MNPMNKKIIIAILAIGVLVYIPSKHETKIEKLDTIEKKIEILEQIKKTKTHKVSVMEIKPDGSKKITVTEDTKTDTEAQSISKDDTHVQKSISVKTGATRASVLIGWDFNSTQMTYGASISKNILGPVSIGAWGLTNKTLGVSFGIDL